MGRMERKRKGYLLRKSVSFDIPQQKKNPKITCTCDNNSFPSSRTYDLQTQTITFGEETKQHKKYSSTSILKKLSSSPPSAHQKPFDMDAELEFYPVDDHPSPSTFTAWDAFLSGNQAFFREPPSDFSYMDVIPEEEDDMEALLESDTDDTGSSVSTVVDRFSRTSTANSSFSERGPRTDAAPFDLQKVLSPFERLEKELDAQKEDGLPPRKNEMQRGPIVVITNSSSCEDVHSEPDDTTDKSTDPMIQNQDSFNPHLHQQINQGDKNIEDAFAPENTVSTEKENCTNSVKSTNLNASSSVPTKTKIVNGFKGNEKTPAKKSKLDKTIPLLPPPTTPKRSYQTPNIPPRMSLHTPARRTRSDPGSPDQPSRIPRPISSANRSNIPIPNGKGGPKALRNPKINTSKKLMNVENSKTNSSISQLEANIDEAIIPQKSVDVLKEVDLTMNETEILDSKVESLAVDEQNTDFVDFVNNMETKQETNGTDTWFNELDENEQDMASSLSNGSKEIIVTDCITNPFSQDDKNPFRINGDSTNPFIKSSNPFEEDRSESIPVLQPKAQISAAVKAPPIPERPSLIAAQKREKSIEKPILPETVLTVSVAGQIQNDDAPVNPQIPIPNGNESEEETPVAKIPSEVASTPDIEIKTNSNPSQPVEFWPSANSLGDEEEKCKAAEDKPQEPISTIKADVDALFDKIDEKSNESSIDQQQQRPIEDILQALDQLVSAPREVEINIDWEARGSINIREKTVLPSNASDIGSILSETDGLTEDRKRSIETLLKEVDECLRVREGEDTALELEETLPPVDERTSLGPGTPDVPTAGSTAPTLHSHEETGPVIDISTQHSSSEMLRSQNHPVVSDAQRVDYTSAFQDTTDHFQQDSKHHSPGCDDSGVFLEDSVASSPETQSKSAISRLQNITLQKFTSEEPPQMRQYSAPEGIDSDAERSDDLGLASSSIDSADDLDGDPLPSTLQICPPVIPPRQKPPPVPARKSLPRSGDNQKQSKMSIGEMTSLEVPNYRKPPLSKSSSSGEDSNFGEGDAYTNEDQITNRRFDENSRNLLNEQKNEQSKNNFLISKSFHEETLLNMQRENNSSQESKANFLARTLSSSSPTKKFDAPHITNGNLTTRINDSASTLKWKSEECLRTAAETKWSIPGRRFEKSVSVKDRIAMFSEMEANQTSAKKDLQRYGSETNIKVASNTSDSKKSEMSITDDRKSSTLSRDAKWQSLHNISKKSVEKEPINTNSNMKSAFSIPSLAPNSPVDNLSNSVYAPLPIKLEVEPPKPIVSTYPETQLTNNKRYNYGLYSLKNLKNTEDLLSKKAAGSSLLSIIDSRKQPLNKLKGLVIPEKPLQSEGSKTLPTIFGSDNEGAKDSRRASLPITVVTTCKTMSLPRNNKPEYPLIQKQVSLSDPPWKTERNNTSISNTLPMYSPAFKKRTLELPGSSLSPTPPSSITSPLSPPPSSPSSICSSNASSTLQQNIFQFSLSHSKPVQPLQPEKALMSPPSLPSDMEYEGDNSEDSSHSASPMRNMPRVPKEPKTAPPPQNQGILHYERSNTFTTSAKPVTLQPLLVESLVKSSPSTYPQPTPRAAICISKTEIHLRRDGQKSNLAETTVPSEIKKSSEIIETRVSAVSNTPEYTLSKTYNSFSKECISTGVVESNALENGNGSSPLAPLNDKSVFNNDVPSGHLNGSESRTSSFTPENTESQLEIPVGKFRACPLNLSEMKPIPNGREKIRDRQSVLHSECDESEDDDSHSTLSHRTEDSRHTTTDDCLSDATTDSFEKARLNPEMSASLRSAEDYASTEGYLSDASTDVSLRRFTHRPMDGNSEDYLSDVTAESPDPDWMSVKPPPTHTESRYSRGYSSKNEITEMEVDLRPKRLSQQQTVLRASIEPSGSVQKFKALAEKWEQRSDVISPPPPPVIPAAPPMPKKDSRSNSISTSFFSSSTTSTTLIKGKSSTLPPSLMPRNSSSFSSERKAPPFSRVTSSSSRSSPESCSQETHDSNGWSHSYEETIRAVRRDSEGSSSGSSKTTLKEEDDEAIDSVPSHKTVEPITPDTQAPVALSNGHRNSSAKSWNNEPRNRRGADFTRSDWSSRTASYAAKTSVSDIRRSFENGTKEIEQPKKSPAPVNRAPAVVTATPPVASPRRVSSAVREEEVQDEEVQMLVQEAEKQLQAEGAGSQFTVLPVLLRREGMDGGSVGITLAGGADYEVKEITVHKVIAGSIADRDGRVLKGDRVMSINGRDVRGVSHGEALHILKAPNPRVLLVLARSVNVQHPNKNVTEIKKQPAPVQSHGDGQVLFVELQKDQTGVGFSIEGGKDSPQGDRPLLIKRIFKGGSADKEGHLEEGDEILSINRHSVTNMTRTEAWNFLKKLPEGSVQLEIRKSGALS
ncbi:mucin-2-like isoform X2 [Argiope bruennichi]|uniref:mucin-2-like isoform X2 n=1 Tax=Argiope bruennichi TaxID=94029 RepID=UPI0024953537|nr:mucin-2-like isoform X2 [Argiope bruennichi]